MGTRRSYSMPIRRCPQNHLKTNPTRRQSDWKNRVVASVTLQGISNRSIGENEALKWYQ